MTDEAILAGVIAAAVRREVATLTEKHAREITALSMRCMALEVSANEWKDRFTALETRAAIPGPPGPKGEKGDSGVGEIGPAGRDGQDVDPELVRAEVARLVGEWPRPADGRDGVDGQDADPEFVRIEVAKAVAALPLPKDGIDGTNGRDGIDGKDADPELVRALVERAVAAIPVPEDGRDGENGADGIGVAGALLTRDGELVLTLSDGTVHTLGMVVGAKGDRGSDGANGKDGFSFEDMEEFVEDGGRVIVRRYRRGDEVKEFRHQVSTMLWQGVYDPEKTYVRGDVVTWDGALWHANEKTSALPGLPTRESRAWVLIVKRGERGRPGRDGSIGPAGPKGEKGDPGRIYS